jgi:hypothetical protein
LTNVTLIGAHLTGCYCSAAARGVSFTAHLVPLGLQAAAAVAVTPSQSHVNRPSLCQRCQARCFRGPARFLNRRAVLRAFGRNLSLRGPARFLNRRAVLRALALQPSSHIAAYRARLFASVSMHPSLCIPSLRLVRRCGQLQTLAGGVEVLAAFGINITVFFYSFVEQRPV